MKIVKYAITDIHYNESERQQAVELGAELIKLGYYLSEEDIGTETDHCDQYVQYPTITELNP